MTYGELIRQGTDALREAGIADCETDARLLLEYVCGTDRNYLFVHGEDAVASEREDQFWKLVGRRKNHIPLQHLTGSQCFMGLDFRVDENVLIPRPDTEILVEEVLKELHDGMSILDMCTGSGCILISILSFSNHCRGIGADISDGALQVAQKNAESLLKDRYQLLGILEEDAGSGKDIFTEQGEIGFVRTDLFTGIHGKYDIIVSNPPYIRSEVIPTLMPEVREHDPLQALDGGADGLDFYRGILKEAAKHLNGGGRIYLEIGFDQAEEVRILLEREGFGEIEVIRDYAGLDRVVTAQRPS